VPGVKNLFFHLTPKYNPNPRPNALFIYVAYSRHALALLFALV